ncbi:MAG: hypothetical protein CMO80_22545 [Verrucomicrobiales bacterium]|nr:hypothetical protein [Verrucomicrobiales bacterium]
MRAVLWLAGALSATAADPIEIGSRRELFVDHYLIEKLDGASLVLHHPTAREEAIRFDQPWEGNTSGYPTVMRDGDRFIMIYRGHRMTWEGGKLRMAHSPVVCYAESRDGIRWIKPHLRKFPLRGYLAKQVDDPLANNIVWPGSPYSGTFVPFLDTSENCPPAEKFKAVGGNRKVGLHLFTSPDAKQWQKSEEAIFKQGALDSMNVAFWEPWTKQYVLYFRTVVDGMRSVAMATSPDLRTWSEPVPLEYPGSPRQQMYTNGIQPYHRAPHLRLGFPTRYTARSMTDQLRSLEPVKLRADLTAAYARVGSDLTDGLFMSSRDGIRFHRWDEAFQRPGRNWMYGDNYQGYGLFETDGGNEISMLFSEGYWREGETRLRRYTIRPDGFVSVQAPYSGGELLTKPLVFKGRALRLNFSTSAAGSLRVEIRDAEDRPIDGYALNDCLELIGDRIDQRVRWKNEPDVARLAGTPVQLRFVIKDVDLYSFRFDESDHALKLRP